jgi:hypothetical protein
MLEKSGIEVARPGQVKAIARMRSSRMSPLIEKNQLRSHFSQPFTVGPAPHPISSRRFRDTPASGLHQAESIQTPVIAELLAFVEMIHRF